MKNILEEDLVKILDQQLSHANYLITERNFGPEETGEYFARKNYRIMLIKAGNVIYKCQDYKSDTPTERLSDKNVWLPQNDKLPAIKKWEKGCYIHQKTFKSLDHEITIKIETDTSIVVDQMNKIRTNSLWTLVSLIIFSFPASVVLSKFITVPLKRLEMRSKILSDDLTKSTDILADNYLFNEFTMISRKISEMGTNLNFSFNELKTLKENLEIEVQKRTAELERLSMVASKTNNGIVITDGNGYIEWVNNAFSRMTEYSFDEVIGKKPGSILQGKDTNKQTIQKIRKAINNSQSFSEIILNYSKSGTPYWIQIDCDPIINDEGEINGFIAIETDVTQKYENEQLLKKQKEIATELAEQASAASKSKSMFLANMSHEIRTPMNGVIGMCDLLLETNLNKEQQEYSEIIKSSADSLLTIINDILDFSKIEAGKMTLEAINFDLRDLLANFLAIMKFPADSKELKIDLIITDNVGKYYTGDPVRLRQVMTNLVGNAIKFTDKGFVKIKCDSIDQKLQFVIQDSGIGISKDQQDKLFNQFTQADSSTTRKYGGTGLGLAISQNLIQMMGGDIKIESAPKEGTSFIFSIDLKRNDDNTIESKPSLPKELKFKDKSKILLVEDNIVNQKIAYKVLQRMGLSVDVANNGQEALDKILTSEYILVMMDCQMPIMDGYAATKHIRKGYKDITGVP